MSDRDRELLFSLEELDVQLHTKRYSRRWRCCRRARGGVRRRIHQLLAGIGY